MDDPPAPFWTLPPIIARWQASAGAERANYALFLTQLCDLVEVDQPEPATDDVEKNAYVFERDVSPSTPDPFRLRLPIRLRLPRIPVRRFPARDAEVGRATPKGSGVDRDNRLPIMAIPRSRTTPDPGWQLVFSAANS